MREREGAGFSAVIGPIAYTDPSPPPAEPSTATATSSPGGPSATDPMATGAHRVAGHVDAAPTGKRLAFLSLGALGVVYGDIGTSPLYAMKECFNGEVPMSP